MKTYERAELQVICFEAEDIFTTSGFTSGNLDGAIYETGRTDDSSITTY